MDCLGPWNRNTTKALEWEDLELYFACQLFIYDLQERVLRGRLNSHASEFSTHNNEEKKLDLKTMKELTIARELVELLDKSRNLLHLRNSIRKYGRCRNIGHLVGIDSHQLQRTIKEVISLIHSEMNFVKTIKVNCCRFKKSFFHSDLLVLLEEHSICLSRSMSSLCIQWMIYFHFLTRVPIHDNQESPAIFRFVDDIQANSSLLKRGWLWMKGTLRFKEYIVVWDPECLKLSLFKHPSDSSPKSFDLKDMCEVSESNNVSQPHRFGFTIYLKNSLKSVTLFSSTSQQRLRWIKILKKRLCSCRSLEVHQVYLSNSAPRSQNYTGNNLSVDPKVLFLRRLSQHRYILSDLFDGQSLSMSSSLSSRFLNVLPDARKLIFNDNPYEMIQELFENDESTSKCIRSFKNHLLNSYNTKTNTGMGGLEHYIWEHFLEDIQWLSEIILEMLQMLLLDSTHSEVENMKFHLVYHFEYPISRFVVSEMYDIIFQLLKKQFSQISFRLDMKCKLLAKKDISSFEMSSQLQERLPNPLQNLGPAIKLLNSLPDFHDPVEKLELFSNLYSTIQRCLDTGDRLRPLLVNSDDLIVLFSFIIVHCSVQNIHAEISFVDTFIEPKKKSQMEGFYLTTFQAATQFLLD